MRVFGYSLAPGGLPGAPLRADRARRMPRTPDGHPDLQGIWTNATITPLERPAALADKATLTDAEAAALEKTAAKELAERGRQVRGPAAGGGRVQRHRRIQRAVHRPRIGIRPRGWRQAHLADRRSAGWQGSPDDAGGAANEHRCEAAATASTA